jgi:hypothetical protein
LPPITVRIAEGSFEAGSVELRVTGAINETEKIDERAQIISLKVGDLPNNAQFKLEELSVRY